MTLACIGVDAAPQLVLRTTRVLRVRQVSGVRAIVAFTERKGMSRRNHAATPSDHGMNHDAREYHHREHRRNAPVHGVIACDGSSDLREEQRNSCSPQGLSEGLFFINAPPQRA
jgi:hypothetical protein